MVRTEEKQIWQRVCGLKIHNRTILSSVQHHYCVSLWLALLLFFFFFKSTVRYKKVNAYLWNIETKAQLMGKIQVHTLWPKLRQWRCGRIGPLWFGQLELEQSEQHRLYCHALNSFFNCCLCVCTWWCVIIIKVCLSKPLCNCSTLLKMILQTLK